jgi:O-antigen ligase
MTTSVTRIGNALNVGPRWAWFVTIAGLLVVLVGIAGATRLGMLPLGLAAGAMGLVLAVSFRWPIVSLLIFAALIPIESAVLLEGIGTVSRFAGILFAVSYGVPRIGRLALGAMPAGGWAFVAWAVVSIGWAINADEAIGHVLTLVQLFVIAVLVADFVVRRPEIVRPVLWAYSISASVTGLIGFQGYLATASRSTALDAQDPAQFAAVLLPAFVFGFHEALNGRRRIPAAAITLVAGLGILISGTRGAWLAIAVAVPFFLLPRLPLRQRLLAVAGAVVLGVALLQVPGVAELTSERLESAVETGGAGRTDIWRVAQTIYLSDPVLGVGYANFPVAYTFEAVRASGVTSYTYSGAAPHNMVVGVLIELGPIGLVLLALLLGPLVLRRGWGSEATTVQAALVALLIAGLFLDVIGKDKGVWLVIGLASGLRYLSRPAPAGAGSRPDDAVRLRPALSGAPDG